MLWRFVHDFSDYIVILCPLMKFSLKHIMLRCFVFLMAIQVLNLSIDAVDFHPFIAANTIGDFNYLNSMTEYFSEIVMGHKDAFPEYQKESPASSQSTKHIDLKISQPTYLSFRIGQYQPVISYTYPLDESYSYLFSKEINRPPKQA